MATKHTAAPASGENAAENKHTEGAEPDADALAALRARAESAERALSDVRAETTALREEHRRQREEHRRQREDFDRMWSEREAAMKAAFEQREAMPEGAPVRGRVVRFAKHNIHCFDASGQPLAIRHGKPIPEGANLDGVGADAVGEREEH